ncbi:MAG: ankyrin repeat domain-containing protein [Rickettsiales bacterium]|nr:ankyrin repeat domain-containing protein [Rickettsiales bacterium]
MSVSDTELLDAAKNGNIEKVKYLVNEGADVDTRDQNCNTPLHLAAYNGHTDTVEALLNAEGINVNAKDNNGATPLHSAIKNNRIDVVEVLLRAEGININEDDYSGSTPLHWAVYGGNVDIVKALLDKGASINVVNGDGDTPLDLTINEEIKALLQKESITPTTEEQTNAFFDSFFSMLTKPVSLMVLFSCGLISWLLWSHIKKTEGNAEQSCDPLVGLNDSDYNDQNDLHLFQ